MLGKQSFVYVADNSGARFVKCIQVVGKSQFKYGSIGDLLVVVVKSTRAGFRKNRQVKKGMVLKGVLIRVASIQGLGLPVSSFSSFFFENAIILLNSKGEPLGTRVFGPSLILPFRKKKQLKLLSMLPVAF
uniref:Ribosomal protein L14 n=1 Tax=Goniomonas avonlea TaxID=1255295 RepID=A0A348G6K9_9CRYP|nr:ribosomal protein L14 [Goniomonas avonlea]